MGALLPVAGGALIPSPAALALVAIALDHLLAEAGEVAEGVAEGAVAGTAQAGDFGWPAADGAEQRFLPGGHVDWV